MHLISARNLKLAVSQYPDLEENIKIICKNIQDASWSHLLELQEVYPSAEAVGNFTVIPINSQYWLRKAGCLLQIFLDSFRIW